MGLFQHQNTIITTRRPPVSGLAVVSLIIAATGFLNIVGFIVGPVLAHIALLRLRGTGARGRRLAIATLWVSYGALAVGILTFVVILVAAYIALPEPSFF